MPIAQISQFPVQNSAAPTAGLGTVLSDLAEKQRMRKRQQIADAIMAQRMPLELERADLALDTARMQNQAQREALERETGPLATALREVGQAQEARKAGLFLPTPASGDRPAAVPALPVADEVQRMIGTDPVEDVNLPQPPGGQRVRDQSVSPSEIPVELPSGAVFDPVTSREEAIRARMRDLSSKGNQIKTIGDKLVSVNPIGTSAQVIYEPDSAEPEKLTFKEIDTPEGRFLAGISPTTGNIVSRQPLVSGEKNKKLTQSEQAAGTFASRAKRAMDAMEKVVGEKEVGGSEYDPSSFWISGWTPNFLRTSERQVFDQAADDFVMAALRKESGAAIGEDEKDNAINTWIPVSGDGEAVMEQKALNRKIIIKALELESKGELTAGAYDAAMQAVLDGETKEAAKAIDEAQTPTQGARRSNSQQINFQTTKGNRVRQIE